MEEHKLICPVMNLQRFPGSCFCQRERCAWYDPETKKCAVLVTAKELGDHTVEVLRDL